MKKQSQKLLQELLEAHPELRKHETHLQTFIEDFLSSRPDSQINEDFKQQLRSEILRRCQEMETSGGREGWGSFMDQFWKPFVLGGVTIGFAVWLIPLVLTEPSSIPVDSPELTESSSQKMMAQDEAVSPVVDGSLAIEETEDQAFDLADIDLPLGARDMAEGAVMGRGGGGGGGAAYNIMPPHPGPYGERINYEYEFDGDLPQLKEKISVYKKKSRTQGARLELRPEMIPNFGLVDMSQFGELSINSITLAEDKEKGYMILMNYDYPNISIHTNYEKWRPYYENCSGGSEENCQPKPLTEKDMLSDSELIRIANAFLKKYNIDTSFLGDPEIEKYWEQPHYQGPRPEYYPDEMTVVYPYLIDGQKIVDQWGNIQGARVSVHQRMKEVTNLHMTPLQLQSSQYPVSNSEDILTFARQGGNQGFSYVNPDKTITRKLGKPELQLTHIQKFSKGNLAAEYYVPALFFPIEKDTDTDGEERQHLQQQTHIVVPLVQDLMKKISDSE